MDEKLRQLQRLAKQDPTQRPAYLAAIAREHPDRLPEEHLADAAHYTGLTVLALARKHDMHEVYRVGYAAVCGFMDKVVPRFCGYFLTEPDALLYFYDIKREQWKYEIKDLAETLRIARSMHDLIEKRVNGNENHGGKHG